MIKRILLVDDEPDVVTVMKFTLETSGFEVITAYDGQEGLEKAKFTFPDLIILDVLMPKLFGDDLAKILKQDPLTTKIPVLFLTNLPLSYLTGSDRQSPQLQQDSKGNFYISKSCSEQDLLSAINRIASK
jgi:CheY-like chemotaxis protein